LKDRPQEKSQPLPVVSMFRPRAVEAHRTGQTQRKEYKTMMPLQTIILLTTGFLLPPVLSVVPGAQSVAGPDDGLHAVLVAAPLHEVAEAQNIEAGGPWLGIQFGPVPKPLAAHLGIDPGEGQMVLNVVEGSPSMRPASSSTTSF